MKTSFPEEIQAVLRLLEEHQIAHALIGGWAIIAWGEPGDPVPGLIRAAPKSGGLPLDMLPARSNADIAALDRAKMVPFGAMTIPIVAPEDLIAMKLEAGGGQDYEDVRRLLGVLSGKLDEDRLESSCRERKVSDRLALLTKS